jgi:hypothetical protein
MFEPDIPRKRAPFFLQYETKKFNNPATIRENRIPIHILYYIVVIYTIIIKLRVNDNPKENYDIIMLY